MVSSKIKNSRFNAAMARMILATNIFLLSLTTHALTVTFRESETRWENPKATHVIGGEPTLAADQVRGTLASDHALDPSRSFAAPVDD
jgi:hypothetical protein